MNPKFADLGRRHGPTLGIAIAAVIAVKLMIPSSSKPSTVKSTMYAAPKCPTCSSTVSLEINTRVVSCGDSRIASISGDDSSGSVKLGTGANGGCTILFGTLGTRTCTVTGGTIKSLSMSDLVIQKISGNSASYECGAIQ